MFEGVLDVFCIETGVLLPKLECILQGGELRCYDIGEHYQPCYGGSNVDSTNKIVNEGDTAIRLTLQINEASHR